MEQDKCARVLVCVCVCACICVNACNRMVGGPREVGWGGKQGARPLGGKEKQDLWPAYIETNLAIRISRMCREKLYI